MAGHLYTTLLEFFSIPRERYNIYVHPSSELPAWISLAETEELVYKAFAFNKEASSAKLYLANVLDYLLEEIFINESAEIQKQQLESIGYTSNMVRSAFLKAIEECLKSPRLSCPEFVAALTPIYRKHSIPQEQFLAVLSGENVLEKLEKFNFPHKEDLPKFLSEDGIKRAVTAILKLKQYSVEDPLLVTKVLNYLFGNIFVNESVAMQSLQKERCGKTSNEVRTQLITEILKQLNADYQEDLLFCGEITSFCHCNRLDIHQHAILHEYYEMIRIEAERTSPYFLGKFFSDATHSFFTKSAQILAALNRVKEAYEAGQLIVDNEMTACDVSYVFLTFKAEGQQSLQEALSMNRFFVERGETKAYARFLERVASMDDSDSSLSSTPSLTSLEASPSFSSNRRGSGDSQNESLIESRAVREIKLPNILLQE